MNKMKYDISEGDNVFFTSDTHFGHNNILTYTKRPFASIEEHDEALIDNWNSVVSPDSTIYHLGDVMFTNEQRAYDILSQLNGHKVLILGNHDKLFYNNISKAARMFEYICPQLSIRIGNQKVIMNHYPFLTYGGVFHNPPAWQIFGHVHTTRNGLVNKDTPRLANLFPTQYDVGVDNNYYKPLSFNQLSDIIKKQIDDANP